MSIRCVCTLKEKENFLLKKKPLSLDLDWSVSPLHGGIYWSLRISTLKQDISSGKVILRREELSSRGTEERQARDCLACQRLCVSSQRRSGNEVAQWATRRQRRERTHKHTRTDRHREFCSGSVASQGTLWVLWHPLGRGSLWGTKEIHTALAREAAEWKSVCLRVIFAALTWAWNVSHMPFSYLERAQNERSCSPAC